VTLRVLPHVWNLRARRCFNPIWRCLLAGKDRFGFRAVEFSVLRDHIHLIVEAEDERALSRGMQGLMIRIAKALNRVMKRRGKVFADRYHARVLLTPLEVKNAMVYVLHNAWRHRDEPVFRAATRSGRRSKALADVKVDECSSAAFFDWWRAKRSHGPPPSGADYPVVAPRGWLLRTGWRRHARFASRR